MHGLEVGVYADTTLECCCTPDQVKQRLGMISGLLLDRVDIDVEVPAVPFKKLRGDGDAESSAGIHKSVSMISSAARNRRIAMSLSETWALAES